MHKKTPKLKKKRKRGGCRDGLVVEMKRQGEDKEGEVCGGGTFFWGCVLDMRQPLHEQEARGLFDVEIGQFESVSFNFSQLTEPPWGPHIPLIGYKLVFLSSHSLGLNPPTPTPFHLFFSALLRNQCLFTYIFFPPGVLSLTEWSCSLTPDVCQSVISIKLHLRCL